MGSTFNPQILVDKLAKLNSSQQSIETLSHWCIFHMNKAKLVVETWDKQFHCSPREQRLAFLYLANDILQNSRRKGAEFVGEFWRFLPDALSDVIDNGDDFGKNAVLRMIGIWEERKVFGSRGQILKDEIEKRPIDCSTRNGKQSALKLKHPFGNTLDRIISGFQVVYGSQLDEDAMLSKCTTSIGYVEKVDKEICGNISSERFHDSSFEEELRGHHDILRNCVEQIAVVESSTERLVSYLREALQEQECKLGQIRIQLQAAKAGAEQAGNISQQLSNSNTLNPQPLLENTTSVPPNFTDATNGDSVSSSHNLSAAAAAANEEPPAAQKEDDGRKTTAAAMADKLAASSSSAQMLTYVLSSLASEGVIGNPVENSPVGEMHSDKRPKLNESGDKYTFPQAAPPPPLLMNTLSSVAATAPEITMKSQLQLQQPSLQILPCLPSYSPPFITPTPPCLPSNPPFFYTTSQQMMPPVMGQQPIGAPSPPGFSIPYQNFQGGERVLFGHHHQQQQQSSIPTVPVSRQ